jgi:hypothetical protein
MNRSERGRRGVVTERDRCALRWLVRNSATTIGLAAKYQFGGSRAMASRRLRVLAGLGLVRQVATGRRMATYIATTRGAETAGLGIRPPRAGMLGEIDHTLLLVDVLGELAARSGARAICERELRVDLLRRKQAGQEVIGRIPDGVLVMPNGTKVAIELDRTAKRSSQLRALLIALLPRLGTGGEWSGVLWVAPTLVTSRRYQRVVDGLSANDVVHIVPLQEVLR